MKKIFLLTILLMAYFSSFAQSLEWAKRMGGTGTDAGYSIAVDATGNVYTTGGFQGTVDFDPGPGTFNLTSVGSDAIFISKLDAAGNFVWAKAMGRASSDYAKSIAVDAAGNVYTTGNFMSTVDFDPGPGTFNLTSAGNQDIFISKLDSAGNFVWAKAFGGINWGQVESIALDADGNVFTIGEFVGTVDFNPGTGVFNLTSAGFNGTSNSQYDIFISKLDADGNFVWAKAMGGPGQEWVKSIAVDSEGNVLTTGYFYSTADFDPGLGTYILPHIGYDDIFISKLDADGNFVWAKSIGSTNNNDQGYSIEVDAAGNVFTSGFFEGTVDFNPGPGTFNLTSAINGDDFISKLDSAGNFIWAKAMGGYRVSLAVDSAGYVFTTGYFDYTDDLDPGLGIFNFPAGYGIFTSKLDTNGNLICVIKIGGTGLSNDFSFAKDAIGNVFITGYFGGTVDFDPGLGTYNLTASGYDIFVLKINNITAAGNIFNDLNANCIRDVVENTISGVQNLVLQPGNIVVQTYQGYWTIDSLPAGTYTATVDTSGQWKAICSPSISFTVIHPDSFVLVTPIGMKNTNPCTEPEISIIAPTLRRCFSNQNIYLEAKNHSTASQVMYNS